MKIALIIICSIALIIFIIIGCKAKVNKNEKSLDLDSILALDDDLKLVIQMDQYLNKITNYGETLDNLTQPQKNVIFIENLEREINNGGFNQFYFNSSGDYSHETIDALSAIGANKTAEIVRKANFMYPNNKVPKDREERINILLEIEKEANPIWEEADQQFYKYEDDLATLLAKYIRENKTDFMMNH